MGARKRTTPHTCCICGCTEAKACVDDNEGGGGCSWVNEQRDLCSVCWRRLILATPAMFNVLELLIADENILAGGHGVPKKISDHHWKLARDLVAKVRGQ